MVRQLIFALKVALIGITLAVSSYQDIKTREIEDKIWLASGIIGAALTAYEIISMPSYPLLLAGFSIALTTVLAFGIFYVGLYGGADAKALFAIAVTMPVSPQAMGFSFIPILNDGFTSPFFPLTVLGNSLLLSLVLIPVCALWNALWILRGRRLFDGVRANPLQKLGAFFTGIRVKPKTAEMVHFNIIEKIDARGSHYIKLFSRITDDEDAKIIDPNSEVVWATPAIPMLVFFLLGFLLSFVFGDFIFGIMAFFMGI